MIDWEAFDEWHEAECKKGSPPEWEEQAAKIDTLAAAQIEHLEQENARLREALQTIAYDSISPRQAPYTARKALAEEVKG